MSKQLLYHLNGNTNGAFRRWLDHFQGEPRIAWYPSAGDDFRDLLYLHPDYRTINPASRTEPAPPDIFLHTDYYPWDESTFLDTSSIHDDGRTRVSVETIEELPRCDLRLDRGIVCFPQGSVATGRVLFLEVNIDSKDKKGNGLGKFTRPVIYAFSENAAFCAEKILPQKSRLSHIVHVRFGGGCGGGGHSTGVWLLNILEKVNCEVLITDNHYGNQDGDRRVSELFPDLIGPEDQNHQEAIRVIRGEGWSGHGDVSWYIVK